MSNGILDLLETLPDCQAKSDLKLALHTLRYCLVGIDYDNPDNFRRQFLEDKGDAMRECLSDACYILEQNWDYCPDSDLVISSPYATLKIA